MLPRGDFILGINYLLITTFAYITAYSLSLGFLVPLQKVLAPGFPETIWLLYLPHGVRIIAFYFFGWKGILYLLPGALGMTFLATVSGVPFVWYFTFPGVLSCYTGYKLGALMLGMRRPSLSESKWKFFLLTGTCASLVNAATLSVLRNPEDVLTFVLGYVIGDVLGLLVVFYILIKAFKFARHLDKI